MTARSFAFALVVVSLSGACAPQPAAIAGATQADTAAINAVRDQEVAALASGDSTLAYLGDDIVMMPPNEPAVVGIPASRAWFVTFMKQAKAVVTYTSTQLQISGDLAVEQYAAILTITPVAGGAAAKEVLKGIHVYRRDTSGNWKMVRDIWNLDAPPPMVM